MSELGYYGLMEAVGAMGTTDKIYICPKERHYQWTE